MFVKPQFTYNYSYIETPVEEEQFIYYISNYNERTFGINVGFKIIQSHGQAVLYSGIFSGLTSMDYESVNQLTKVQNNTSLYILGLEFTATQIRYILFLEIKYGRTPIKVNSSGSQYRFNVNVSDEIELNSISLGFKFK